MASKVNIEAVSSEISSTFHMPSMTHYFKPQKFLIQPHLKGQSEAWKHSDMEVLCKELCQTKSMLDKYYTSDIESKDFSQVLNLFDPFRTYKYRIAQSYRGQNVSNAWLKFWELICEFKLIPNSMPGESFISFDNAALPGSGILAINHYVKTSTSLKSHVWYACSLDEKEDALADSYSLVKNYPSRWLMNSGNNGDVTKLANLKSIFNQLSDKIDLYTSDLGFDVSSDYNGQEDQHCHCNLGQILLGMYVLKKGGNLVVKMYTFFSTFTQSLLIYCSKVFEKFYITKPMSSRVTNSECYLVGIDFLGIPEDIQILETRLDKFSLEPLIPVQDFYNNIFLEAAQGIYGAQISSLLNVINLYDGISKNFEPSIKLLKTETRDMHNIITSKWVQLYPFKSLRQKDRLNCIEVICGK